MKHCSIIKCSIITYSVIFLLSFPVEAFSTHPQRPSLSRERTNLAIRKKADDDAVVGYVPSGLTAKQYAKIKKEELAKKQKMDFGAWGPRFARSDRPDGDWMVVPSLWTNGFGNNAQYSNRSTTISDANSERSGHFLLTCRNSIKKMLPVYMVVLFMIEMIVTSFNKNSSLINAVNSQIMKKAPKMIISTGGPILKLALAKMAVASLLVKPFSMLIEKCNRRMLWSPRRTMTMSSITSSAIFLISLLLRRLF